MMMLALERNLWNRPRLVFGYGNSALAANWGRWFRRNGWEVHLAATAEETYDLVHRLAPTAVILEVDLPDESGWLACAKLTLTHPDRQIYLLSDRLAESNQALARFSGAVGLFDKASSHYEVFDEIGGNLVRV